MFPKSTIAGAAALLAAPIVVIAAALIQPTLSGDASAQVTALTSHHQAMITGKALVVISSAILFAGFLLAVRTLHTATRPYPAAESAPAIAVS
jgi:hypothetical protein